MEQQNSEETSNKTVDTKRRRCINTHHRLLCEHLLDFAKNTTLHGLRYVTERGLSLVEKIFWAVTFILSLTVCIILMRDVWIKWQASKVFVTFSERITHVSELPFPAVTFCPHAKIDQRMYNYTQSYFEFMKRNKSEFNETFIKDLFRVTLICNHNMEYYALMDKLTHPENDNHRAVENIIEIAPTLNDSYLSGAWFVPRESWKDPFENLNSVLTEEGVCFTFNSLAADEILTINRIQNNYSYLDSAIPRKGWSLDGYFYPDSSRDHYPRRGQNNGARPVVAFVLKESMIRDELCDGDQPGFKVYLHYTGDLPQTSLNYYMAVPEQINSFAISVDVIKSSESLARCPADVRQCYFSGERDLKYFNVYSKSNCELECLANFSLANCGCVWFHMPHEDSTKLCWVFKMDCLVEALEKYFIENGKSYQCNCLPTCSSIQYEAEVYKTSSKCDGCEYITSIQMHFKKSSFVSRVRECTGIFGLTDFLAYCGGLLGLFLGFSFLSLMEILYFCTLRLGCIYKKVYG